MVIPCTDASIADGSGYDGVSRVIAVKGDCFANYDAASWASALDAAAPSGVIFAAATPQSKDLLARIAAKRGVSVVQDVVSIEGNNLTSPIYSGKAMQTVAVSGDAAISVRANVFPSATAAACEVSVVDQSGDVATAVQEIIAGQQFYGGTHAVVVSNAGFTKSAQTLASKTGVILISDEELENLEDFLYE